MRVASTPLKGPKTDYRLLRKVRKLHGGRSGATVWLLEQNVVCKTYPKLLRFVFKKMFKQEVIILQKLVGCPFVPQLIAVDHKKMRIWSTYCGTSAPANPQIVALATPLFERLAKWGVYKKLNESRPLIKKRNNVLNNITIKDDCVYLIDFGGPGWFVK